MMPDDHWDSLADAPPLVERGDRAPLVLVLDHELLDRLKQYGHEQRRSFHDVAREAIERVLDEEIVEWRVKTQHPATHSENCVQLHNCVSEGDADLHAGQRRNLFPQATVTIQRRTVTQWTDREERQ